jgi:hypothetical protein
MPRRLTVLFLILVCALATFACSPLLAAGVASGLQAGRTADVTWGVKIPMRDGVNLNATLYPGKNMPMVNNIHNQYWIQWFLLVAGNTLNHNLSEDRTFWEENFRELYVDHLPFESLDRLASIRDTSE